MPFPPREPCPHNLPWIPNRFEPGGYNCSADLCYLDPYGDLYSRDDHPQDRRSLQRSALLEMQNRDAMRRAAKDFASKIDKGANVLAGRSGGRFVPSKSGSGKHEKRSPERANLVVPMAEREEKYESQSLLKKLFSKKPTSELERRYTGIEPDGAWTPPGSSRREKSSSRHESVRREPSRRETSKQPSSSKSSKVPSSNSRYPSIAGPPARTPTTATRSKGSSKSKSSAPHEKEIEKWEERNKARKAGKTIKTQGYKLGDMARSIVEGQL